MIGLDLADLAVDGCTTKAPGGGECAGRSPVDRGTGGMKRSPFSDGAGIPMATVSAPANTSTISCWPRPSTRSRTFSRCPQASPCTSTPDRTTGPAVKYSTNAACTGRSPTAARPPPSRSASGGWSSGPTPGSTTSADSVAVPNAAKPASTATSPRPQPLSLSVRYAGPPGASTAGTPGQDQHASADLLAGALSLDPPTGWGVAGSRSGSGGRGLDVCGASVTSAAPGRGGGGRPRPGR